MVAGTPNDAGVRGRRRQPRRADRRRGLRRDLRPDDPVRPRASRCARELSVSLRARVRHSRRATSGEPDRLGDAEASRRRCSSPATRTSSCRTQRASRCTSALIEAGVPAELHVYADAPHAFDATPEFGRQVAAIMALFLDRYVANPRSFVAATPTTAVAARDRSWRHSVSPGSSKGGWRPARRHSLMTICTSCARGRSRSS